jgi:hypothetical protein
MVVSASRTEPRVIRHFNDKSTVCENLRGFLDSFHMLLSGLRMQIPSAMLHLAKSHREFVAYGVIFTLEPLAECE